MVGFTLSQATKSLRESRGIALLYFRPLHLNGVRGQRHAPAAPYPRERPGTHCTGGWVGLRTGLDRCGKSRRHRDSIPGPSRSRYTDYATRPSKGYVRPIYLSMSFCWLWWNTLAVVTWSHLDTFEDFHFLHSTSSEARKNCPGTWAETCRANLQPYWYTIGACVECIFAELVVTWFWDISGR